eukprot:361326-Chlamydomonas_euryale.AAC.3
MTAVMDRADARLHASIVMSSSCIRCGHKQQGNHSESPGAGDTCVGLHSQIKILSSKEPRAAHEVYTARAACDPAALWSVTAA